VKLFELFDTESPRSGAGDPSEPNPFLDENALYESQIVDIRYDAIRSTLGIVFEMRLADWIRDCSAALIVASDVSAFSWEQVDRNDLRTAWTVLASRPRIDTGAVGMELLASPNARMHFSAGRASYYSLTMAGVGNDSAPPDYTSSSLADLRNGVAGWHSTVEVVRAVHV
jgi:hypothetical protein